MAKWLITEQWIFIRVPVYLHVIDADFMWWLFRNVATTQAVQMKAVLPLPSMWMMASSNGIIFRVTGHLSEEFTGHR